MLIALTKGAKTASFLMITHRDHKALKIVLTEIELSGYPGSYTLRCELELERVSKYILWNLKQQITLGVLKEKGPNKLNRY